jgi:hypothetical protein
MIIISRMMEAVSISETSVNFYQSTRHNIQEDSYLHNACPLHIITVYSETHTKPINTFCEKNAELMIVKADGTYRYL